MYGQLNPDAKQKPSEAQINQYWRDAFWQELALNPNQKVSLYAKKLYAMFHLHEGYNNKTYAFQKSQNPFLAINPLNFLWVSALAFAGWLLIYPRPREAGYLLGLTLLYAASAAVFYASDRFRLPVVMPLCVLAGAATMIIPQLRGRLRASPFSAWRFLFWRCALIVSWVIVFSLPLWGVGQTETRGADYLLGAQASLNRGDSKQALKLAQSARKLQPQSQTAIQVALKAGYNSLIEGDITPDNLWVKHQLAQIDKIVPLPSSLRYMAGYYEWLLRGSRERWHDILAEATPGKLTSTQINALGAVIITNSLYPNEIALLQSLEPRPVILDVALAGVGEGSAMASLVQSLGQKEAQTTVESYRKLFDRQHFIGLNSKNAH